MNVKVTDSKQVPGKEIHLFYYNVFGSRLFKISIYKFISQALTKELYTVILLKI